MDRFLCALAVAVLIFSARTMSAQAGVYALFTGANLTPTGTASTRIYGPTIGIYADFHTPVVSSAATSAQPSSTDKARVTATQ